MSVLFISSTGNHAGKSLLAWAIALRLMEKGKKVGYFKPFSVNPVLINGLWTDSDAVLFRKILDIDDPVELICPNIVHENSTEKEIACGTLKDILFVAGRLLNNRDVLIVSGSKHAFFNDLPHAVPDASLISELNAGLVLIHRYKNTSETLYSLLSISSLLKENIRGIVINRVPPEHIDEIKTGIIPVLNKNRIFNITAINTDPYLSCWNLREICELLNGRILYGEEYLDRLIGRITAGTGDLNEELMILKRVYNKIILMGPSGKKEEVAGILLTGNRMPPDQVIAAAQASMTPLIMIKEDSFSALERLERTVPVISSKDTGKASHFMGMLDRDNFLNTLIESI